LVGCILSNGGTFLDKDEKGWYIVDGPGFIYCKVNQALVEINKNMKQGKNKKYVAEPTDNDVLTGRSTRFRHHTGNVRYREEVERFRERYNNAQKGEEKNIINIMVRCIQSNGGNFLEKDEKGWFIIQKPGFIHRKIRNSLLRYEKWSASASP